MENNLRVLWNNAILLHQSVIPPTSFKICERHFAVDDFSRKNGRRVLKNGAVPSIFDSEPIAAINSDQSSVIQRNIVRKKYCKIKHCCNEIGTNDTAIKNFR